MQQGQNTPRWDHTNPAGHQRYARLFAAFWTTLRDYTDVWHTAGFFSNLWWYGLFNDRLLHFSYLCEWAIAVAIRRVEEPMHENFDSLFL